MFPGFDSLLARPLIFLYMPCSAIRARWVWLDRNYLTCHCLSLHYGFIAGIVCVCVCVCVCVWMQQRAQHPSSAHGSGNRAPQPPIKYTLVFTLMPAGTQMCTKKNAGLHTCMRTQWRADRQSGRGYNLLPPFIPLLSWPPLATSNHESSPRRIKKDYGEVSFANQRG